MREGEKDKESHVHVSAHLTRHRVYPRFLPTLVPRMPCSTAVCIPSNKVEVWSAEIAKPAEVTFLSRGPRSPNAPRSGEEGGRKEGRKVGYLRGFSDYLPEILS